MGLFDKLMKKGNAQLPVFADNEIAAPVKGTMVPASELSDQMFREELLGQTIGFVPDCGTVVAPVNGTLEVLFPTGHAFCVRMKDGAALLVHIGVETVSLEGKGFTAKATQGQEVKAGQPIIEVDFDVVKEAGLDPTVMLLVAEAPSDDYRLDYIDFGAVEQGQKISK